MIDFRYLVILTAGMMCLPGAMPPAWGASPGSFQQGSEIVSVPWGSNLTSIDQVLQAAAMDREGRIWLGGSGPYGSPPVPVTLGQIAADGSDFVGVNNQRYLYSLALLSDGWAYAGGYSDSDLARIGTGGVPDTAFIPQPFGGTLALAALEGGGVIQSHNFDGNLHKFAANGNLDASWNPNGTQDGAWTVISMIPGGGCHVANGGHVTRLSPAGEEDRSFLSPATYLTVNCMQLRPDGRLYLGGHFTAVNGVPASGLARLLPDGSLDSGFMPALSNGLNPPQVRAIFLQTDGSLLVTGDFTHADNTAHPGTVRLLADGKVDPSFNLPPLFAALRPQLLTMGPDGSLAGAVLNGNGFKVFRMENGPGESILAVEPPERLIWKRNGALPELSHMQFEFRSNGSSDWTVLGPGQRAGDNSGWVLETALAANGALRATGWTSGNRGNLCVTQAIQVGTASPSIQVLKTASPAGSGDFGLVSPGGTGLCHLQIRNTGNGDLKNLALSFEGEAREQFSIIQAPPETLEPDGLARITIGYTPPAAGASEVTLRISSNDPARPSLSVPVSGNAQSAASRTFLNPWTSLERVSAFDATGQSIGALFLNFVPDSRTALTLVSNVGGSKVSGHFANQPQGSLVQISGTAAFPGTYVFAIDYQGGDGNDIVLRLTKSGLPDTGFAVNLGTGGMAQTCCRLRNGQLLIGGSFKSVNEVPRRNLTRLNADGTLDTAFDAALPPTETRVAFLSELEDGKILIASGKTGKIEVRRLHPDGEVDSTFWPLTVESTQSPEHILRAVVPLAGDRVLLAGYFTKLNGQPRNFIAMTGVDGQVVSDFHPPATSYISGFAEEPDGSFLIGTLTAENGPTGGLLRLNRNGSVAAPMNLQSTGVARYLALEPDGHILCSSGSDILRLGRDGTPESRLVNFGAYGNGTPFLQPLADGKVIADGSVQNSTYRTSRLNQDFKPDGLFGSTLRELQFVCPLDGGHLIAGGTFTNIGVKGTGLARLIVEPSTENLSLPEPSTIRWMRGGTAPQTSHVSFSLFNAAAAEWVPLGRGRPVPGGWELTGLALPGHGTIRATARVGSGWRNGSFSLFDSFLSFGPVVPDLQVHSVPGSVALDNGGGLRFGTVTLGNSAKLRLCVTNPGEGLLRLQQPSLTRPESSGFAVSKVMNSGLNASGQTEFEVTFTPSAAGFASDTLSILSNDPDSPVFLVNISGLGTELSPVEAWRMEHFGVIAATGPSADLADPDGDGLSNLAEYALGLQPLTPDAQLAPAVKIVGSMMEIRFTAPSNRTDISYGAEWARDSSQADWVTLKDEGNAPLHVFRLPIGPLPGTGARAFLRLKFAPL